MWKQQILRISTLWFAPHYCFFISAGPQHVPSSARSTYVLPFHCHIHTDQHVKVKSILAVHSVRWLTTKETPWFQIPLFELQLSSLPIYLSRVRGSHNHCFSRSKKTVPEAKNSLMPCLFYYSFSYLKLLVTTCTTSCNTENLCILPQSVFLCFASLSQQTFIYNLKLFRRLNSIKLSRSSRRVRWLDGEWTNASKTTCSRHWKRQIVQEILLLVNSYYFPTHYYPSGGTW